MAGASSSSGGSFKYDVFINFRGKDTRRSFVCHLYEALKQKALGTFIDSEELRKGDDLSELFKAIQGSTLSIVVFSKNYASSTWCLKELVQILECMDRQSQIVVPIFYKVDPSHVRKRKETFAEAFAKHKSDSNVDKKELKSWKSSLERATNLSGYHSRNYRDDIELIGSIVEDILKKLIHISPSKTDALIGMDSHMDKIDSLLEMEVDDFRIVGIWGMDGIGKSTIAQAVFQRIGRQFEHKCFLDNVKEGFLTKNGAVQKVEEFQSRILKVKDRRTLDGGRTMIRERLGKKKILLVLDDVDNLHQIETLIGEKPTFGGGSRIIITTSDKKLLAGFLIYEPKLFTTEKALELFSRYAFRTNKHSESYDAISRRAVEYAHGLPLALKVLGALLDNKTVQKWEYELEKIEKIPTMFLDKESERVLWASYDSLDEYQKKIFLDIACFFERKDRDFVTKFHESCGFFPQSGLTVLVERSLVTVSLDGKLEMPDLIQKVGREIVRRESTEDPRMRSRLWGYEDVSQVLAQNTAKKVEGIILDLSKLKELYVNEEVFVSMRRLRLLQLSRYHYGDGYDYEIAWTRKEEYDYEIATRKEDYEPCVQDMSGNLKFLSNELRVLVWHGCPLRSFPNNFLPNNLIYVDMCYSRIEQLWEGTKPLQNLVYIDLSCSRHLINTPDFTRATNLEKLYLEQCTSLLEVHPSISDLESLVVLDLRGCSNLRKFPNISRNMKELRELYLSKTEITKVPSSINDLLGLQTLSLAGCRELWSLPSSFHMKSLESLDLSGNKKLESLPEMNRLGCLERLYLEGCERLKSIPELSSSIRKIDARDCTSLEKVSTPQPLPAEYISLEFFNCFLLVNNTNIFIDIVESATQNQVHYSLSGRSYHMYLPGSDIPDWFNHQSRGSSVTVQLPPNLLANNFLGFAICAISNLRGDKYITTLQSAYCCCTLKANDGHQDNSYFSFFDCLGGTDRPLELDHMFLRYTDFQTLGKCSYERKYTEARFRIVVEDNEVIRDDWEDCTWITRCGVRLLFSGDPICNLKKLKIRSKRERGKEKRGRSAQEDPYAAAR